MGMEEGVGQGHRSRGGGGERGSARHQSGAPGLAFIAGQGGGGLQGAKPRPVTAPTDDTSPDSTAGDCPPRPRSTTASSPGTAHRRRDTRRRTASTTPHRATAHGIVALLRPGPEAGCRIQPRGRHIRSFAPRRCQPPPITRRVIILALSRRVAEEWPRRRPHSWPRGTPVARSGGGEGGRGREGAAGARVQPLCRSRERAMRGSCRLHTLPIEDKMN
uniref:Uncharacterized protein n=1 Tax=Oryza glumipatula TaxID=40148 RepID=A0A0E0AKP8_9ORYZ